ncbi:MAG TPA: serine hydrolase [Chryseosolibacter sp.]|nr:serine hydrolase [Chryseosolibacter sp.]
MLLTVGFAGGQSRKQAWVDSVFQNLDADQKIAQLLMTPVSSHLGESKLDDVEDHVKSNRIGGIVFTTGEPRRQLSFTNRLQSQAQIPLLVATDAANGLSQLDSTLIYPPTLAQGAFQSDSLVYNLGRRIGFELRSLGVHMNLGLSLIPANSNQKHLSINRFSDNKHLVLQRAWAFMQGMSSEGILACGKYFEIDGVTITDIEKQILQVQTFVDTANTFVFRNMFRHGLNAVMPAAKNLPVFIQKKSIVKKNPLSGSTLASFYAADWLRRKMQYNGLVIVDLRLTETENKKLRNGDAELYAFIAGNDLLISSENPNAAIRRIKRFLKKNSGYKPQLDASVKRVLSAKYDAGLNRKIANDEQGLMTKLASPQAQIFQRETYQSSITVLRNDRNVLPLVTLENKNFASIFLGDSSRGNNFQQTISKYVPAKHFLVKSGEQASAIRHAFTQNDVIIVGITDRTTRMLLDSLSLIFQQTGFNKDVIIADMGSFHLDDYAQIFPTIVTAYIEDLQTQKLLPQAIFGAIGMSGVSPINLVRITNHPSSLQTKSLSRLQYSFPEDAGINGEMLQRRVDAIALEAIEMGGTPGCHVFVAKEGKVIFEKSYGHYTYENVTPVTDSTIYDLASVTKVSATLQAVMFLYDRGMLDLNRKASYYLPELRDSNKKDATLKDILTHQAGLWPYLPFWAQTVKDTTFLPAFYSRTPSLQYPLVVSDRLFASASMPDSLWSWTIKSKLREKPLRTPYDYKYSDMGFYIMHHLSETLLNQRMNEFLMQNLYEPLGAYTTGYVPLMRFPVGRIAPTENDRLFRRSLLIGTVHDQGAAMHGGIAGHAGLFSNANDLGKLAQMLLQDGYYGGYQYYRPETVKLFTKKTFESSKRGLGWDRPTPSETTGVTSVFASQETFGHTGFTGTCMWIDPKFNLVYIFLSNRVHPDMTNNKLLTANIRSRIQDVIYESILDYCRRGKPRIFSEPGSLSAENTAANNN